MPQLMLNFLKHLTTIGKSLTIEIHEVRNLQVLQRYITSKLSKNQDKTKNSTFVILRVSGCQQVIQKKKNIFLL